MLIGGVGEKRTLRLVAQYADACNVFDIPDGGETVRHKLGVLRGTARRPGATRRDREDALDPARAGRDAGVVRRAHHGARHRPRDRARRAGRGQPEAVAGLARLHPEDAVADVLQRRARAGATSASPSTSRVSRGSITPSSHSRAVA